MKRLLLLFFSLLAVLAQAQSPDALRKKEFNIKKGIAIEGYDPVSYFNAKPLPGKENLSYAYKGITYQFASTENLNKFKATPDQFEPAYGGWCAYAMGDSGEKVKVDPETFKIINHKLYLFYNFWGNNTLDDWNENEKKLKDNGDKNWRKIYQ